MTTPAEQTAAMQKSRRKQKFNIWVSEFWPAGRCSGRAGRWRRRLGTPRRSPDAGSQSRCVGEPGERNLAMAVGLPGWA